MSHEIRHPPHIEEDLDVVIIGAGPAGLGAAAGAQSNGLRFALFEAGREIAKRSRNSPEFVTRGVGGAGLYSDGKFSFYPSASALWKLPSSTLLEKILARGGRF